MNRMDAIRITNLVKKYGTVTAVENLSLAVPPGTMFGFLGPERFGQEHHHRLPDRPARPHLRRDRNPGRALHTRKTPPSSAAWA